MLPKAPATVKVVQEPQASREGNEAIHAWATLNPKATEVDLEGEPELDSDAGGDEVEEEEGGEEEEEEEEDHDAQSVPPLDHEKHPAPKAGKVRLSYAAINGRLRRLMKPTVNGTFKVSEEVRKDFFSAGGGKPRKNIELIFQMCGYDKESYRELLYVSSFSFGGWCSLASLAVSSIHQLPRMCSSKSVSCYVKSFKSKK